MNDTPFRAERFVNVDKDGYEVLIVVVKATFELPRGKDRAVSAAEQVELWYADLHVGDPASSSIRYEADIGVPKRSTDVALLGHAHCPQGRQPYVDVSLRVGELRKAARVFGDRHWERGGMVLTISAPKPFDRIPLVYERAFGGADLSHKNPKYHEYETRNPVGVGFLAKASETFVEGTRLPNIENPRQIIGNPGDRPVPHCFGFVAKHWAPRVSFQGTYDEAWKKSRMPLLPLDFDDRFHNAGSPELVASGYLVGGEPVEVRNATAEGYLGFYLPAVQLRGSALIGATTTPVDLRINTVVVDTDTNKLFITWRGMTNIHKRVEEVRWVRVEQQESQRGRPS